jgi:GDP-L-fucose synthase
MFALHGKKVFVAGHKGMVGSAIVRRLADLDCQILTLDRKQVDLTSQVGVHDWMMEHRPEAVFLAAAKVGGIKANNDYPAEFLYENLAIELAVIHAAYKAQVRKLMFLGSSCIYPRMAPQPITEDALLTGPLEPTNEWYAIAKIAGLKLCEAYRKQYGVDFISAMPTNLYGPGDNYDLEKSHVVPALIRKAHEAKLSGSNSFPIWGEGKVMREFMHVDDMADACLFLMENYSSAQHVNVGTGSDVTIYELAQMVCDVVGFTGDIKTDPGQPEGTPRKLMDSSKLTDMGWRPRFDLQSGLKHAYESFVSQVETGQARLTV